MSRYHAMIMHLAFPRHQENLYKKTNQVAIFFGLHHSATHENFDRRPKKLEKEKVFADIRSKNMATFLVAFYDRH